MKLLTTIYLVYLSEPNKILIFDSLKILRGKNDDDN
jgi:hypothetical protein